MRLSGKKAKTQAPNMKNRMAYSLRFAAILVLLGSLTQLAGCDSSTGTGGAKEILNVSYDPTRELYKEYDVAFARHWKETTGETVTAHTSQRRIGQAGPQRDRWFGGLGGHPWLWPMTWMPSPRRGLLAKDWQTGPKKLPNNNSPYTSTILFLVRKGNPKGIHDWDDLIKPGDRDHHAASQDLGRRPLELPGRLGIRAEPRIGRSRQAARSQAGRGGRSGPEEGEGVRQRACIIT